MVESAQRAAAGNWGVAGHGVALASCNALDALFTTAFLELGWATEANPLMRWLYDGSPALFLTAKLLGVNLGIALLWSQGHRRLGRYALQGCTWAYLALLAWHLAFLARALEG